MSIQHQSFYLKCTEKRGVGELQARVFQTKNCQIEQKNRMDKIPFQSRLLEGRTWHISTFCGIDLRYVMYLYIPSLKLETWQIVSSKSLNM